VTFWDSQLFNSIWNKEEFLQQCNVSIIVPVYENIDKTDCSNYSRISLLSTPYKILSSSLISRLTPYVDKIIGDHQYGFQHNGWITDHIFCICQILEKKWVYNGTVHQLFANLEKAYDSGEKYCTVFSLNLVYLWN